MPTGVQFRIASEVSKYFDRKKKTVLITHGWISSIRSEYTRHMREAFWNKTDLNIIIMDWSKIAGNKYSSLDLLYPYNNFLRKV